LLRRIAIILLPVALLAVAAHAGEKLRVNVDTDRVAINGYDTVAYFTEERAVEGSAEFEHAWQDARWRFASAEHRDLFAADPERYAPRYGGFCTGGMALGRLWTIDPEAWAIVDDRLYLNFRKSGRDEFVEDPEPYIERADANWAKLNQADD
jgi:hypothetical protein